MLYTGMLAQKAATTGDPEQQQQQQRPFNGL